MFSKFSREKIKLHIFLTIALGIPAVLWAIQSVRAGDWNDEASARRTICASGQIKVSRAFQLCLRRAMKPRNFPQQLHRYCLSITPNYEVIAVDDRSADATGKILDDFAAQDSRLRVIHITELPPGWLGKPHALNSTYQLATAPCGFVFTDADVIFAPDSLKRIMTLASEQRIDHLALMTQMMMVGFWERVVMTYVRTQIYFGN